MSCSQTRRRWLIGAISAAGTLCLAGNSRAQKPPATAPTPVAVPDPAIGAVVAAVGAALVRVEVDPGLGAGRIQVAEGKAVPVTDGILLKGKGRARARVLDDARNATKLGGNVRDALQAALPAQGQQLAQSYRGWARSFARKVMRWDGQMKKSKVRGRRIKDVHGRIYLLHWAGATVDPKARSTGPAALAKLPTAPPAPTMAAYERYIARLVAAVT